MEVIPLLKHQTDHVDSSRVQLVERTVSTGEQKNALTRETLKEDEQMFNAHLDSCIEQSLVEKPDVQTFIATLRSQTDHFLNSLNEYVTRDTLHSMSDRVVSLYRREVDIDNTKILIEFCKRGDKTYELFIEEI